MSRLEKLVVLITIAYVVPLVLWPWLDIDAYSRFMQEPRGYNLHLAAILVGFVLGVICIVITIRDIRARQFSSPKAKMVWTLVAFLGGTPGWVLYLYRHGFRSRVPANVQKAV